MLLPPLLPTDHMALLAAYRGWKNSLSQRQFADEHFLSHPTLQLIGASIDQFKSHLKALGLYTTTSAEGIAKYEECAENLPLVRSLLVAALYPNIATVVASTKRQESVLARAGTFSTEQISLFRHPSLSLSLSLSRSPSLLQLFDKETRFRSREQSKVNSDCRDSDRRSLVSKVGTKGQHRSAERPRRQAPPKLCALCAAEARSASCPAAVQAERSVRCISRAD
jgi:C4-dicarboxylate-specific signal transduction histidine kinase